MSQTNRAAANYALSTLYEWKEQTRGDDTNWQYYCVAAITLALLDIADALRERNDTEEKERRTPFG